MKYALVWDADESCKLCGGRALVREGFATFWCSLCAIRRDLAAWRELTQFLKFKARLSA